MAAQEGWNPGIHDAQTFFEADPAGFVGVSVENDLIGGGAIVRHNEKFGFMGLFLVAPEHRGQGIGRKLWYARRNLLLDRLAPGASIGMDGVSAMVDFYREGGFVPQYISSRFQTEAAPNLSVHDPNVTPTGEDDFESVREFDGRCFPGERVGYLLAWLRQPDVHQYVYRREDGKIGGFGTLRPCLLGWKIGPLFAETPDIARSLIGVLISAVNGEQVSIDVPSTNPVAQELCRSLGMSEVFQCTRMYFGPKPVYQASLIYGLTSFELG